MTAENSTTAELSERFSGIYTGAITDTMDEIGYYDQTLDPEISPLIRDMSLTGIAFPIEGRPNRSIDPEQNIRSILKMIGDAPENAVLMYNTNDNKSAHIGELTTTALNTKGCRGAVVDGGARDTKFIIDQEFPVFRRYDTPSDCVYRWEIIDWGTPTVVGGVEITPGDIVVGDADGVVVVPEDIAAEVYEQASERVSSENKVRNTVKEGMTPLQAYDKYGAF